MATCNVLETEITNPDYINFLKVGLALNQFQKGICPFITSELQAIHGQILANIGGPYCDKCTRDNILLHPNRKCKRSGCVCWDDPNNSRRPCPTKDCKHFYDMLVQLHQYGTPQMQNVDFSTMFHDPWQVAKCFLPPSGYATSVSANDCDGTGLCSIIINCKHFEKIMGIMINVTGRPRPDIFSQVKDIRNHTMHSAVPEVDENDMKIKLDSIIRALQCGPLRHNADAMRAADAIMKMKDSTFKMSRQMEKDLNAMMEIVDAKVKAIGETVEEIEKHVDEKQESTDTLRTDQQKEIDKLRDTMVKLPNRLANMETEVDDLKQQQGELIAEAENQRDLLKKHGIMLSKHDVGIQKNQNRIPPEILRMDSGSVEMYKRALADGRVSVHSIRVMLVGHSGVGKTTLLKRLLNRPVIIDEQMSTEGIEVHVCHCKVDLKTGLWINSEGDTRNLREDSLARCLHFSGDTLVDKPTEKSVESNNPVLETTPSLRDSQEDIGDQEDDPNPDQTTTPDSHQPQTTVISNVPEEDTKHVENFLKVRISLPDEQYASVSFWDFAGQSIFYNTHQVFLANRTIYLLLTNLEKNIDTTVAEGETNKNHGKKVKDFVDFWVNSIHFFCGKGPPVILVATHADKLDAQCRDRRIESHFQSLRDIFDEKVTGNHIRDDIQFAIDNTRIDEKLEDLKKAIFDVATEQEYWGELQPARWITLEQELDKLRRDGRRIVEFVEVEGINQRLPVPLKGPDEIDLFLRFQNDTGNFLFVSEEGINHFVLLDPQWVIDALKCVITADDFLKNKMAIRNDWKELKRTGKLTRDIIDAVWEKKTSFSDHKQFLLLLMQRLNLIARYEEPEKDSDHFFVPCFIKERADFEDLPSQIGPHTSSVLTLTVPSMFFPLVTFHKLIASCINHFKIRKKGERYYIYNECAVFWAGNACLFTLFYIDNGVKVWVTGPEDGKNAKYVNKACQSVLPFLLNVIKRLKVCCNEEGETEVDVYAPCPKLPFSNVQDSFKVPTNIQEWQTMELDQSCDAHEGDPHALSKEDLLRNWILCVNCDYANPRGTCAKKDILILHSNDESTQACNYKRHLENDIGIQDLTVDPFCSIDVGQSFSKSLETVLDRYRLVLVYHTENTKDNHVRLMHETILKDSLFKNQKILPVPVFETKDAQSKYPMSSTIKPINYYHFVDNRANERQMYIEMVQRMVKTARRQSS